MKTKCFLLMILLGCITFSQTIYAQVPPPSKAERKLQQKTQKKMEKAEGERQKEIEKVQAKEKKALDKKADKERVKREKANEKLDRKADKKKAKIKEDEKQKRDKARKDAIKKDKKANEKAIKKAQKKSAKEKEKAIKKDKEAKEKARKKAIKKEEQAEQQRLKKQEKAAEKKRERQMLDTREDVPEQEIEEKDSVIIEENGTSSVRSVIEDPKNPSTWRWTKTPSTRFSIRGDFDGDGFEENLYEGATSLFSDNPDLNKVDLDEDLGVFFLANEGDLDGDGGDEISFMSVKRDLSNLNYISIWTYTGNKWKELFRVLVHEWDCPNYKAQTPTERFTHEWKRKNNYNTGKTVLKMHDGIVDIIGIGPEELYTIEHIKIVNKLIAKRHWGEVIQPRAD